MIAAKFICCLLFLKLASGSVDVSQLDHELDELVGQLLQIRSRLRQFSFASLEDPPQYTNEWVVEIFGGLQAASNLARSNGYEFAGPVKGFKDFYIFRRRRRTKRAVDGLTRRLRSLPAVKWAEQQRIRARSKRNAVHANFNDPLWRQQWQLHERRDNTTGQIVGMNIEEAWAKGYTGKRVVVSILDDGIEHDHTDLRANYVGPNGFI
ncbi:hypothetical protein L596_026095 [Steinernema carpocapsae]|uniref:Peptidase S8 pro-domain domain-containing protein n=1 Tax=Steinernema carpocapsae TaxID=34508 RepID=A0A4U5M0C3_STECR|nr:hypothetical protein L596_026095 [Steinernema carpocapsae]